MPSARTKWTSLAVGLACLPLLAAAAGAQAAGQGPATQCDLPDAAVNERIVVAYTKHGSAASSVSLVGPDRATTASQIAVEPGDEPIFLVVASVWPMVSVITGDTQRLSHVVVASRRETTDGKSAAGVVGVPPEVVSPLLSLPDCLDRFFDSGPEAAEIAERQLEAALGRKVDAVRWGVTTKQVFVPSGRRVDAEPQDAPIGFDPKTWRSALETYPAGLVEVDPAEVVSVAMPERYRVLPGHFGLAQLVHSGAMERLDGLNFRLVRPIPRYPPGLLGSQIVRIFLAPRAFEPKGDPGGACVVSEATGEPVRPVVTCSYSWLDAGSP
jgi:hypothetical protein